MLTEVPDLRAPRFRSTLERLAGVDGDSPSAARLTDALQRDRRADSSLDALAARYRSASAGAPDLRSSLERLATDERAAAPRRAAYPTRANGAALAYERGPSWRLENPRGDAVVAARKLSAREEAYRKSLLGGGVAPGGTAPGGTSGPTPLGDPSLGLGASDVHHLQDDLYHHVHHHHYYSSYCYGGGWWNSSWGFGFGFSFGWPGYGGYLKPLWLHHPIYGTYPWYGGYALGYCGISNWYLGSYGSWSWGYSPYAAAYYDNGPDVIVVESSPEVIVVEQPVYVETTPVVVQPTETVVVGSGGGGVPTVAPEQERLAVAADRYLTLGDRAFRDARYDDAVDSYAKAVELAPDEPVLKVLLADALFAVGDYGSAADAMRRALQDDPLLARTEVDKREFYSEPRAFDRQLAVAELYLAEHPADSDARLILAINLLFSGSPASALDLLESDWGARLRSEPAGRLVLDVARERLIVPSESPVGASDSEY
ncbi:Tetratricopeptide repeat protein [Planctomycetes bacterium Pla163]|uniref:Tetratricopeptide repeat protein n=1 Tax=Rohdeia mirabilis TaxID=2528008 RepID=A0A518D256_9BACT|nr:Tetratricopeptide repeat protein [Planctomycetes bacterium Pla163]